MLIGALTDNFNDGTVDPVLWPNSYGPVAEVGGRARIPCNTGYTGYKSATTYTLADSGFTLRAWPPAGGGGTSAACSILVVTTTGGTDAGFIIDAAQSALGVYLRSGYSDPGAVFLTYSATDHAWLRLRETAGTLYWDTSPDGATWTNRRTATTPAWAADSDLSLVLEAHRDAGTDDYAEVDDLNVPAGQTIALDIAVETDSAQSIGRAKTAAPAPAGETGTTQSISRRKTVPLGAVTTVDEARPVGVLKALVLAPAGETSTAQPVSHTKTRGLNATVESSAARSLAATKTRVLAPTGETDTAVSLTTGTPLPDDLDYVVGDPVGRWKVGAPWS